MSSSVKKVPQDVTKCVDLKEKYNFALRFAREVLKIQNSVVGFNDECGNYPVIYDSVKKKVYLLIIYSNGSSSQSGGGLCIRTPCCGDRYGVVTQDFDDIFVLEIKQKPIHDEQDINIRTKPQHASTTGFFKTVESMFVSMFVFPRPFDDGTKYESKPHVLDNKTVESKQYPYPDNKHVIVNSKDGELSTKTRSDAKDYKKADSGDATTAESKYDDDGKHSTTGNTRSDAKDYKKADSGDATTAESKYDDDGKHSTTGNTRSDANVDKKAESKDDDELKEITFKIESGDLVINPDLVTDFVPIDSDSDNDDQQKKEPDANLVKYKKENIRYAESTNKPGQEEQKSSSVDPKKDKCSNDIQIPVRSYEPEKPGNANTSKNTDTDSRNISKNTGSKSRSDRSDSRYTPGSHNTPPVFSYKLYEKNPEKSPEKSQSSTFDYMDPDMDLSELYKPQIIRSIDFTNNPMRISNNRTTFSVNPSMLARMREQNISGDMGRSDKYDPKPNISSDTTEYKRFNQPFGKTLFQKTGSQAIEGIKEKKRPPYGQKGGKRRSKKRKVSRKKTVRKGKKSRKKNVRKRKTSRK